MFSIGGGGSRSPIAYQFHMALKAAGQQDVTLVCSGAFDMPLTAAPIRLPELRQALGDYAEVRVKAEASCSVNLFQPPDLPGAMFWRSA